MKCLALTEDNVSINLKAVMLDKNVLDTQMENNKAQAEEMWGTEMDH